VKGVRKMVLETALTGLSYALFCGVMSTLLIAIAILVMGIIVYGFLKLWNSIIKQINSTSREEN